MATDEPLPSTDRFLPRKGNLRSVWLAGLNTRLMRRDYERVNLVRVCSELVSSVQLNLSVYSLFLVGTARVFERQVYYLHGDANKIVIRLKQKIDNQRNTISSNKVTLPDVLATTSLVTNEQSFSAAAAADCQYLPDSEFFIIDCSASQDQFQNNDQVSNQLDITLPDENNGSSLVYSINQSPHDFSFYCDSPVQNDDDCYWNDHSVDILPSNNLLNTPNMQQSIDVSIGNFISPLDDVNQSAFGSTVVLKTKSVKRRLVFDQVTQLSDKAVKNNAKTWKRTLRYIKIFNKASSAQLLNTPVNLSNEYSETKFLTLWKLNAVVEGNDYSINHEQEFESIQSSMEVLRGTSNNSEMSNERWTLSLNSDRSISHCGQDVTDSRRIRGSGFVAENVGFLPPIPDLEQSESDYDLSGPVMSDYEEAPANHDLDESKESRSVQFYSNVLLPRFGEKRVVLFKDLLPDDCSKLTSSLMFMYILELVQKGLIEPIQSAPYGSIVLKLRTSVQD